jgi:diguanylate cyclase (GGDEF)-like protein
MLDIDYFKSVNDVYGHIFGDEVLKEFACAIKKEVRAYDTVFRYGGEEFTIISPGLNIDTALRLGQRLLNSVRTREFGDEYNKISLRVSIGLASFPEDKASSGMELISLADRYLKKVKESGGNGLLSGRNSKKLLLPAEGDKKPELSEGIIKDRLKKLYRRTTVSIIEQITAFANRVNEDDPYFVKHNKDVAGFSIMLAKKIKLSGERIDKIHKAALVHDIGKAGIPKKITLKNSRWDEDEFEKFKQHSVIGADILSSVPPLSGLAEAVKYHHERWDGKGYPEGLRGKETPLEARIVGLADAFTALLSDRYHRSAHTKEEAEQILQDSSGIQFDPALVDAFLNAFKNAGEPRHVTF